MNQLSSLIIEESFENLIITFDMDRSLVHTWKDQPFTHVQAISKQHPVMSRLWGLSKNGMRPLNKSYLTFVDPQELSKEVIEDFLVVLNYLHSNA